MKANRITAIYRVEGSPYSVTGAAEVGIVYQTPRGNYKKIRFSVDVHHIQSATGVFGKIRQRFKELAQQLANDL